MHQRNFTKRWSDLRPDVAERWPQLTAREIDRVNGRVEALYRLLWSRGGLSRGEAAGQLREFLDEFTSEGSACGTCSD